MDPLLIAHPTKPCPFCGAPPGALATVTDNDGDFTVECGSCAGCGPAESTRAAAAVRWDTRV